MVINVQFDVPAKETVKEEVKSKLDTAKAKAKAVLEWCKENPEIVAGAVAITVKLVSGYIRRRNAKMVRMEKERTFWDPVSQQWLYTRKTPTARQKIDIANRRAEGENIVTILGSMRLL